MPVRFAIGFVNDWPESTAARGLTARVLTAQQQYWTGTAQRTSPPRGYI